MAAPVIAALLAAAILHASWRYGESGQVYPPARGLPPLLVALIFADGRPGSASGLGFAVAAGVVIAATGAAIGGIVLVQAT